MKTILIALVACIVCAIVGGGIGWHLKGQAVAAAGEKQAKADTVAITRDFQQQANEQTARLNQQQADSSALLAKQNLIRSAGLDLRVEIEHAQFTPPGPIGSASAPACPDPSGTAEFERLYDAAAKGERAAPQPAAGAR